MQRNVFNTFPEALQWAKRNAADYCHAFHYWKVERVPAPDDITRHHWAIAVYSRNTDAISHFA